MAFPTIGEDRKFKSFWPTEHDPIRVRAPQMTGEHTDLERFVCTRWAVFVLKWVKVCRDQSCPSPSVGNLVLLPSLQRCGARPRAEVLTPAQLICRANRMG